MRRINKNYSIKQYNQVPKVPNLFIFHNFLIKNIDIFYYLTR